MPAASPALASGHGGSLAPYPLGRGGPPRRRRVPPAAVADPDLSARLISEGTDRGRELPPPDPWAAPIADPADRTRAQGIVGAATT